MHYKMKVKQNLSPIKQRLEQAIYRPSPKNNNIDCLGIQQQQKVHYNDFNLYLTNLID